MDDWLDCNHKYIINFTDGGALRNTLQRVEIQGLDNYNGVEVFVDLVGDLDINDAKQFKSA
ncbi:hypothetical protein YC2023_099535 [Brassica napus]